MVKQTPLLFGSGILLACATLHYGVSDAELIQAREVAPRGAALFNKQCTQCHGQHGEGKLTTPPVLGRDALPEYPREPDPNSSSAAGDPEMLRLKARSRPAGAPSRDPFRNAGDLYKYLSSSMPPSEEARALMTPDDYWALVNFILLSRHIVMPSGGVTVNNANSVKL